MATSDATEIAKIFSKKFLSRLAHNLNTRAYRKIIRNTRVPCERELYGIVSSILNNMYLSSDMPVLTEFAASRDGEKGRIDFVTFNPSPNAKAVYLIELKVSRIAASHADTEPPQTTEPINRVRKPWESALEQIRGLNDEEIRTTLGLNTNWTLAKIAVVVYFHVEYGDWDPEQKPEFKSEKNPDGVTEFIRQQIEGEVFAYETVGYDRPLITRRRAEESNADTRGIAIHGFSLIAGMS